MIQTDSLGQVELVEIQLPVEYHIYLSRKHEHLAAIIVAWCLLLNSVDVELSTNCSLLSFSQQCIALATI